MFFDLQTLVNLIFSFIDFSGFTLLSLAIYRIPITLYWKRLLVIQLMFIVVMIIHNNILMNKDFYSLSIVGTAIILSTFLLRVPFLYSSLIWGTGYLLYVAIQGIILFLINWTGIVEMQELLNQPIYVKAMTMTTFLVNMLIYYIIERKRLGFMFIMNRFRLQKRNIQAKDIFIATLLVCTVSLGQLGLVSLSSNNMNQYLLTILLSIIVISLIGLYITYKFNMKEIDERFNSLRGKNNR